MTRRWYVLKTKPRAEEKVCAVLIGRQVEVYLPKVKAPRATPAAGRREALFPGYVFAHIDVRLDEWVKTRSAPGVAYVLGCEGKPSPVPEAVIDAVRKRLEACGGEMRPRPGRGDRVAIIGGPLRGLEAVFDTELTGGGRSRVLLSILGRLTPLSLNNHDLRLTG